VRTIFPTRRRGDPHPAPGRFGRPAEFVVDRFGERKIALRALQRLGEVLLHDLGDLPIVDI